MDKLTYGQLSPDREFVKCNFYDHLDKAREIYPTVIKALGKTVSTKDLYAADDGLLDLGWTKIIRSEFTREWYIICYKFTKAQYDFLKPLIENKRIETLSRYRFERYEDREVESHPAVIKHCQYDNDCFDNFAIGRYGFSNYERI